MLLIGVTGPIGAGKTSLLVELASETAGSVDGFVQIAHDRGLDSLAQAYSLLFVADGREIAWVERGTDGKFVIDTTGVEATKTWAQGLASRPPADLIVLDEFGRWEAAGEGHLPLWPSVEATHPRAVAIAVRSDCRAEIESQLGRPFDVYVDASDSNAMDRVRQALGQRQDWERVGLYGAGAGGLEASVGSAFHAVKFPLTGVVMSTTQAIVMTHAADGLQRRDRVIWVGFISAGLKALSPAGSRLGPMLAISVEGIFVTLGYRLFGWNRIGAFIGGGLAGAWAGLQGFFVQYLLLGRGLQKAYDSVVKWLGDSFGLSAPGLLTAVFLVAAAYGLVAGSLTMVAWSRRDREHSRLKRAVERHARELSLGKPAKRSFWAGAKDVLRPAFLIPIALVSAVLIASGTGAEEILWMILRALGVGLALFGLIRLVDPAGLVRWLQRRGQWGPAYALGRVLGSHRREIR